MSKFIIYSSILFIFFISASTAPPKNSNLQDDFSTEQIPSNQNVWSYLRNFFADLLSNLSSLLSNNQPASDLDPGSGTPRPIVSVINTIVEALRSGSSQRLIDSIIDQFNQLVGRIGRMYSDGIEREVYLVEQNPKINKEDRLVLNDLVTKMRLTQVNIEKLSKENETEMTALEDKINSIKSNLNDIWENLKNMYTDYHQKSTNVSHLLDRLDFIDPKQLKLTASELQTQLNKLWKDLSRNLVQTIDGIDLRVKKITKQTLQAGKHLNEDVDVVREQLENTHENYLINENSEIERSNTDRVDPIESIKKLDKLTKLSNLIRISNEQQKNNKLISTNLINNTLHYKQDKVPLNRYLRSVDRLQIESEKMLNNDLKKLINHRFNKLNNFNNKFAKLQLANDTNDEDDSNESNTNSSSNDEDGSMISDPRTPELEFDNESQLKKFTNLLRKQFNASVTQFTNYWRGIGKKLNEARKNFNQTNNGRKFNFDPFNFKGNRDLDQDSFYDEHIDDLDYLSSYYSNNC